MKLLIDWGTSNLRAWLVDEAGQVHGRHTSELGLLAANEIGFAKVFDELVERLDADPQSPAILFGMIGSQKGWIEVPYVPTPVDAACIARSAKALPDRPNIWVVGGVSHDFDGQNPEVMRGEEVQSIGVLRLHPNAALICLPGTHTKWVRVDGDRIVSLKTYMTGELFHLISRHSIISTQIEEQRFDHDGFLRGLALAREPGALTHALFQLRTRYLTSDVSPAQVYSMASGLLIGHELLAEHPPDGDELVICASSGLTEAYRVACDYIGLDCVPVDPEQATLAGLLALAPHMEHGEHKQTS